MSLPFSPGEYARRLGLVRREMDARGLQALFLSDPSNMAWLTGYDGWSFYVPQGVIVPAAGDPFWWGRGMDAPGAARTTWLPAERILAYADGYVMADDRHPMQDLAARIADLGLTTAAIGVEMDAYYYTAAAHRTLSEALPAAKLRDATGLVNRHRGVKSAEELVFMRRAAAIAERVVSGAIERARPGLAKNELVAAILADQALGADGHWGDYPAIVPMLPSGADAAAAHLTWDGAPLRAGEATFFELAGCYRRYHVPLCRTVMLGRMPPEMQRAEAALVAALEAGIAAARPGALARDVALAVAAPLEAAGIDRQARCGYPVGLSYPPDWGERTISLRESDHGVLQAGMTFHLMPGLWMDGWGIEITETILIRDGAPAEPLCHLPRRVVTKA